MEPALLDDRAVLAISGPEARDFLQGLVTNDVAAGLAPGTGLYTALLSPQGKILFDFLMRAANSHGRCANKEVNRSVMSRFCYSWGLKL